MSIPLLPIRAYWRLNELNDEPRVDASGNGHTLTTITGNLTHGAGLIGNCVRTGDVLLSESSIAGAADIRLGLGPIDFTVWGWYNLYSDSSGLADLLTKSGDDAWFLEGSSPGGSGFFWKFRHTQALSYTDVDSPVIVPDSAWHFILVEHIQSTKTLNMYIDDVVTPVATATHIDEFAAATSGAIRLAFRGGNSIGWAVDEVGIASQVYTEAQRGELYNSGDGWTFPAQDLLPSPWDVRAYTTSENGSDVRVYLPVDWVTQVSFEITERGGFGEGNLKIIAPWSALPGLLGSERFDVWLWNVLVYRGWMNVHQRDIDTPEMFAPQLAGLIETLGRTIVDRRYAYSQPQDVARVWGDLVTDYLSGAGIVNESQDIGATLQLFDARDTSLAEAFNRLCDQSPGSAIWGHDTTSDYSDRLYLRPRSTSITKRVSIGGEVQGYAHPYDTGAVRNVMRLRGGQVAQPNLVSNGSFEDPQPPSETVGNLITDYSFEDNSVAWSATSTGSRKYTGMDATAMGAPRSGTYWYEIDQNGEKAEQVVTSVISSLIYTASCWIRREDPAIARTFTFEVEGLDVSNVVQTTITIAAALDPGGSQWRRYSGDIDFTGFPTVVKALLRIRAHAGTASNDGILVDDVAFYERDSVANAEWTWSLAGAATRVTLDWHAKDVDAYHGGYSVKMLAANIALAADYLELRNAKTARVNVKPGQSYVVAAFIRGDGTNSISASIGVSEWKADDTTAGADTESATMTGNLATWTLISATFTAASTASTVDVWLRDRANTILYADAFALIETALPVDWYSGGYWESDTYERVWDTNIIPPSVPGRAPVGLSSAASTSIATWGRRETVVQNDQIVDEATGQAFAIGWFNAHAVPQVQAALHLTATRSEDLIFPSGLIRLLNLPSAPDALFPSRIRYTIDGEGVEIDVDLGSQRPELVEMLRVIAGKRISGELPVA